MTRLKETGAETSRIPLQGIVLPDDLIVVEGQHRKVYVSGEVRTPGEYPFKEGLTVHKAITLAGGFTDKAAKTSTKVLRKINGKEQTVQISLDAEILAADIILVPQRFF